MMDVSAIIHGISVWALPLIFAVTLHEAAHGYAARALGDDTAHRLGRITLNPIRHIDPLGTLVVPGLLLLMGSFLFGWAKPVPVNFSKLRNPRSGMVLVAAAGPATNLAMAFTALMLLRWVEVLPDAAVHWARLNLANAITINLLLAVFNMLPIPPLDGGRVAVGLLPRPLAHRLAGLERFGLLIVLGGLMVLPMVSSRLGLAIDPFAWLIQAPMGWLLQGMIALIG